MMIKVAVCGACGRLGSTVCDLVAEQSDMTLAAGVEVKGHPRVGEETHGAIIVDDLESVVDSVDVVVDFTNPDTAVNHARICASHGGRIVIGTTGLKDKETRVVGEAAEKIPAVLSPNMSVGVNLLFKLAGELGRVIPEGFDVEISESHHRGKKDAPSGTAVKLANILTEARELSDVAHGREGMVGERPRSQLGMHAIRAGDIVGEHTILFAGDGERFEITHRAHSRRTFAAGTMLAIRYVAEAGPGLYDMMDVLGLRTIERANGRMGETAQDPNP